MPVKPIPDGYQQVIPYLVTNETEKLLEFVRTALGAEIRACHTTPDGKVAHAEARIGDSTVMFGGAPPGRPVSTTSLYVYVPDVDATYRRAIAAGAKSMMEPSNQFYGDRNGAVIDAAGNTWCFATHVEDVPPDEMERRSKEHAAKKHQ
jgi:uncharacterized glyoxalase superfamily protein PhnB